MNQVRMIIKRFACVILSFLMIVSSFSFAGLLVESYAEDEEIVEIYTIDDLYAINENMSGNYKLMNDLDMTTATSSGGAYYFNGGGWDPIGYNHTSTLTEFTGTFDGDGHTISGLNVSATNGSYAGLFGSVGSDGEVKNLTVSGSCSDDEYAGMIAGSNCGIIINCSNLGDVLGNECAGGVAGINCSKISNCHNGGKIKSLDTAGGIAGKNNAQILNCYNSENISVERGSSCSSISCGGITGENRGNISQCFNLGTIKASFQVESVRYSSSAQKNGNGKYTSYADSSLNSFSGGIAGVNYGDISDSYNAGEVISYSLSRISCYVNSNITWYIEGTIDNDAYGSGITYNVNDGNGTNIKVEKCYNRGVISTSAGGSFKYYRNGYETTCSAAGIVNNVCYSSVGSENGISNAFKYANIN